MEPDQLAEILRNTKEELDMIKKKVPLEELHQQALKISGTRNFRAAVTTPGPIRFIAEIKRKSPSGGDLKAGLDPRKLAVEYETAGASALSILTNGPFFGGSLADLIEARKAVRLPILRKDFIIDPYQIFETKMAGADALLLIVAALTDAMLGELFQQTLELGITPLVEVHNASELKRALQLKNPLIGINNRNLKTLTTDLSTVTLLEKQIPAGISVIAESGYKTPEDIRTLGSSKVRAVLVGESLLRQRNPGEALRSLIEAGKPS